MNAIPCNHQYNEGKDQSVAKDQPENHIRIVAKFLQTIRGRIIRLADPNVADDRPCHKEWESKRGKDIAEAS